eukprot:PhM_4_TR13957/c0_g1_i1/m.101192
MDPIFDQRDVDENEVLNKYHTQYPGFACFQHRQDDPRDSERGLEERFLEFEVEKQLEHTKEHNAKRLELFTSSYLDSACYVSVVGKPKDALQLRAERERHVEILSNVPTSESFVPLADALVRETALCEEARNTPNYLCAMLKAFFNKRKSLLPRKMQRYLHRWGRYATRIEALSRTEGPLCTRLRAIEQEQQFTDEAIKIISHYEEFCRDSGSGDRPFTSTFSASQSEAAQQALSGGNKTPPPPLDTALMQVYLRDTIFNWKCRRRAQRFLTKAQWLAMNKREVLYRAAVEHAVLEQDVVSTTSQQSSRVGNTAVLVDVPVMARHDDELAAHLEELATSMQVAGQDKQNAQEFEYNARRTFTTMFSAQVASYDFKSYDLRRTTTQVNEDASRQEVYEDCTYLRHASWEKYKKMFPQPSPWQREQESIVGGSPVDSVLQAELSFLAEDDQTKALGRLKDQCESHDTRAEITAVFALGAADAAADGVERVDVLEGMKKRMGAGGANVTATVGRDRAGGQAHRRMAFYLLRSLRIRELRRRLLDTLNYFRSIERRLTLDTNGFQLPNEVSKTFARHAGTYCARHEKTYNPSQPTVLNPTGTNTTGAVRSVGDVEASVGAGIPTETYAIRIQKLFDETPRAPLGGPAVDSIWSLENRDDSYAQSATKTLQVIDHEGNVVMYDAALEDLEATEKYLVHLGSHFVGKREHSQDLLERGSMIDRVAVLEDLYECETWFAEAKRKVLDCYMEAYEHTVDVEEQGRLAQIILDIMTRKARINLQDNYFPASYTVELVNLELEYNLLREMINVLQSDERKLVVNAHRTLAFSGASNANVRDSTLGQSVAEGGAAAFGLPDPAIQDSRLFQALFPGSCVINVLEIVSSLGVLSSIPELVEQNVVAITRRFQFTHPHTRAAIHRAVLQELVVTWRMLGEEERLSRQIQNQISTDDIDDQAVMLEDASVLDKLLVDIVNEEDVQGGRARKQAAGANKDSEKSALLPPPQSPQLLQLYCNALEAHHIRASLIDTLYATELLYNIHRKHGKLMGMNVRRVHLEPLDFDQRKTHSEVDEATEPSDLTDVISLPCEYLTNLAITEFDPVMGQFDLRSYAGMKKLLLHSLADLRRALLVQVTQRNCLISSCLLNMQSIDYYEEGRTRELWQQRQHQAFVTQQQQQSVDGGFEGGMSPRGGGVAMKKQIIPSWPQYKVNHELDRATLGRMFVSVNHVKSIHRKVVLSELNSRMAEILSSRKPEQFRKKMKELKAQLVQEYCLAMAFACYKYAARWQINQTVMQIEAQLDSFPAQSTITSFFVHGQKFDVMRPTARSGNADLKKASVGTCMLARNGRMEDVRYLPHPFHVAFLDWDAKDKQPTQQHQSASSTLMGKDRDHGRSVEHHHTTECMHLRTNFCLGVMLRVLNAWNTFLKLTTAYGKLSSDGVVEAMTTNNNTNTTATVADPMVSANATDPTTPTGSASGPSGGRVKESTAANVVIDVVRSELRKVQLELEAVNDTTDTDVISALVCRKPDITFYKILAAVSTRIQHTKLTGNGQSVHEARLRNAFNNIKYHSTFELPRLQRIGLNCGSPLDGRDSFTLLQYVIGLPPTSEEKTIRTVYRSHLHKLATFKLRHYELDGAISEVESAPLVLPTLYANVAIFDCVSRNAYGAFNVASAETYTPYDQVFDGFLSDLMREERYAVSVEVPKLDGLLEEVVEEAQEISTSKDGTQHVTFTADMFDKMCEALASVVRRDLLKDEYTSRLGDPRRHGGGNQRTPDELEETYLKMIVHRGRVIHEKELAASNKEDDKQAVKYRRRARTFDRELYLVFCRLLRQEILKSILRDTVADLSRVNEALTVESLQRKTTRDNETTNNNNTTGSHLSTGNSASLTTATSQKLVFLRSFVSTLMSRATKTRSDGDTMMYHIPETSIQVALDALGDDLLAWREHTTSMNMNAMETMLRQYQATVFNAQESIAGLNRQRALDMKALSRRVQARVSDERFGLIFCNDALVHENTALKDQIKSKEDEVRIKIRAEFENEVNELRAQTQLLNGQFATYKKKLYHEMQTHLGEIKKGAMLNVGRMESAPLHMKRQALRIAATDEETNKLKDQNQELRLVVAKLRLWNELKLMQLEAHYQKKLEGAAKEVEEARTAHWGNKEATQKEKDDLRNQLSATSHKLTQVETEVEHLRKDLQLQLKNKKDLVALKVHQASVVEELQKKLRKYDRWANIDVDRLVLEYERKQAEEKRVAGEDGELGHGTARATTEHDRVREIEASHQRELQRLSKALGHERTLKAKAFETIEQMRQQDNEASEAYLWQRKYFECAAELQRVSQEFEMARKELSRVGVQIPSIPTTAFTPTSESAGQPTATVMPSPTPVAGSGMRAATASSAMKPKIVFSKLPPAMPPNAAGGSARPASVSGGMGVSNTTTTTSRSALRSSSGSRAR